MLKGTRPQSAAKRSPDQGSEQKMFDQISLAVCWIAENVFKVNNILHS